MKKLIFAVLVAAIGTTAIAKNTGGKASKVKVNTSLEDSKLELVYLDESPSTIIVKFRDAKGQVVSKDKLKNVSSFNRPYDLSHLSTGIYTIEVADEEGTFYETSALVDNSLSAVKPSGKAKYQLTFKEDLIQPVQVTIFNDRGTLIFKETVTSNQGFSKTYDLSKIKSDRYMFEVKTADNVETHKL
ncbi:MAG: hypothetical protein RIF33_06730 [Cyclobacteriaceae bacterium]